MARETTSSPHQNCAQVTNADKTEEDNKTSSSAISRDDQRHLSQTSRIRHVNNYHKTRHHEDDDGFLQLSEPFWLAMGECPRQTFHVVERMARLPEPDIDVFGIVSKRALPEHYYVNTGYHHLNGKPVPSYSKKSVYSLRRDVNIVPDFSHPRCFANPSNNFQLIQDSLDSDSMTSKENGSVVTSTNAETPSGDEEDDQEKRNAIHPKTIRFDFYPKIIELLSEDETESADGMGSPGSEITSEEWKDGEG